MRQDSFFNFFRAEDPITQELYRSVPSIKRYDRFKKKSLPEPRDIDLSLSSAIKNRESFRDYSCEPITQQQISDLLFWSAGYAGKVVDGVPKRAYPSGGGLYPVEMYLYFESAKDLKGLYYYSAHVHQLVELPYVITESEKNTMLTESFAASSAVIVFFSFKKGVSFGKYGNLAYKLALIESGTILQNIHLVASTLKLGCCAMGKAGNKPNVIEDILRCDPDETVLFSVAIGGNEVNTAVDK